ncbi:MerR family transcriptional regulator [Clostridium folliculivorans]|uniref:MerR family transcriptional regulator n=1 Tax=Clostridium folliculivorans TaxID=2886038 RepID=A0A9W6DAW5_9CLOT|nr:MerR family transcriptional regulator [Clostridium folliculivorans]GKU25098.1 MerR family transcriptional regulator [Clostridium folliculivorans]GKU31196.1 MerR family transcriptional regulator [Clostridium folliculivorans]
MKINEVMKITGLTKKAIYYYENTGLINPAKDYENNYRIYTDEDVDLLKKVDLLRKLEVPVKDIAIILSDPFKINEVMVKQLHSINDKIKYLNKSKNIIESLLEDYDDVNKSLRTDSFEKLSLYLDIDKKACEGYMKKELKRIFPGNFGKAMSFFLNAYLDEPIDTEEKERAWYNLVNVLDSVEEIKFPNDIKTILDRVYENTNNQENFQTLNKEKIDKFISELSKMSTEERQALKTKMESSVEDDKSSRSREDYLRLRKFFSENQVVLPKECSIYLRILSKKYNELCEYILNVQKITG